jgi:putative aldouronate transport system substrate-binding protein
LGVDFKAQVVPGADYIAKLQTTLAGNDLPDILQVFPSQVSQIPGIAKAKFQDLSDYLSGDAIKKYPNLAAISTTAWTNSMIGGRIYGVVRNSLIPHVMLIRSDLAEEQGVGLADIKTFDDFFKACETFTDTRKSTYACAYPSGLLSFLKESCAVPNVWKEDGGHLTWANETDQMKDALTAFAKLWKAGLLHPDSFTNTNDIYTWLVSGRTAMMENSLNNLSYIAGLAGADEVKFAALHVPSYNGATPVCLGSTGYDSITAIRKTSDSSRVEELLSVLNWMAAPFGSEEQQFCFFGVPDVDFTIKDGQPAPTTTGQTDTALYLYFLAKCDDYLYFAGRPDDVRAMHDYAAYVKPAVIFNPVIGLYSETDDSDGPALAKTVNDAINDIMQGRKAVTALDGVVDQWRKNGGDKIRQEYEDAMQEKP